MADTESRFARMSRRAAITGAALATMALAACGGGAKGAAEGDIGLGAPEGAKVTVVEYASVSRCSGRRPRHSRRCASGIGQDFDLSSFKADRRQDAVAASRTRNARGRRLPRERLGARRRATL